MLSRCLAKYGISEKALKAYEDLHYPRTKEINQKSLLLGQIGQWENPVATSVRNLLFSLPPDKLSLKLLDKYFGYNVARIPV